MKAQYGEAALEPFSQVSKGIAVPQRHADSAFASMMYGLDWKGDQERVSALTKCLEQLQQASCLSASP